MLRRSPPVAKRHASMVATDEYRDTAGGTRTQRRDAFREAQLVEHGGDGGEGGLRACDLRGAPLPKCHDRQNSDIGHPGLTSAELHSTAWPVGEPILLEVLATSLPLSPLDAPSHTGPGEGENMPSMFETSTNELNGSGSHSRRTSQEMSSRSMSLDSTTTVFREVDDQLRYPRPESPSISSFVVVRRAEEPTRISEKDLKLLLRLRRRVQLLRLKVQGQRVLVESKREEQSDSDERYIKWIRTHHVSKENPSQMDTSEMLALETLWRQCQAARDVYGPVADSLVSLEYGLEVEEARLEQIEERVYGQLDISQSALRHTNYPKDTDDDVSQSKDHKESSDELSQASRRTSHVDYNDYLWRLGNLDLLQERHQGIINERSMLEEEREKRQRVGLDLDLEDLEFLAHFDDTLEPVSKEVAEVSADVERLKQLCIERGLMDVNGNPTQTPANDPASNSESGEEMQSNLPAEHSKLSQHQEPSGNNEPESRVSDSHGGFGPFINLWLLHKLRSSAMEILLLACFVATSVHSIEGFSWKSEALRLWDRDGTEKDASGEPFRSNEDDFNPIVHASYEIAFSRDKEKQIAPVRKTFSLKSTASRISIFIKSYRRSRARSGP